MATRPIGNVKQLLVQDVGEHIVTVGRGKKVTVLVNNPSNSVFDVIGYTMTPEEATERVLTRTKFVLEAGVSAAEYAKATNGNVAQIGVDMTTDNGDMNVDVVVTSEAVSK